MITVEPSTAIPWCANCDRMVNETVAMRVGGLAFDLCPTCRAELHRLTGEAGEPHAALIDAEIRGMRRGAAIMYGWTHVDSLHVAERTLAEEIADLTAMAEPPAPTERRPR